MPLTKKPVPLLQRHLEEWGNCTRCELHKTRTRIVLGRGRLPCDVLFIGEAPGDSEDVVGQPFVGPAGQLLDSIIEKAFQGKGVTHAFTNIVGCIPRDSEGAKDGAPDFDAIMGCMPRVTEFVEIANPKLVIAVGKVAWEWLQPNMKSSIPMHKEIPVVQIVHPAAIIRANYAQRGLMGQRCSVTIMNAVEDFILKEG